MNFLFKKRLVKMNNLTNILSIFVLGYFVFLVFIYVFQRNLLYHPTINNYHGHKLTVAVEKLKIKTEDNIELLVWYHNKKFSDNKNKTIKGANLIILLIIFPLVNSLITYFLSPHKRTLGRVLIV